jgi:drug/metabolite transporter (DMT)-like permease
MWLRVAGASVMLLGVPAVVSEWAQGGVPDTSQAALFALVPFVVVAVAMARELAPGEEAGVQRFFAPALAGFGGALFLLPFSFPVSARGRTMFGVLLVAVVVVGFASVWIYRLLRGFGMMEAFAVVCLSNALFLGVCALLFGGSWSGALSLISISSLCYLLELFLLVWLLREMSPVRLATRYLVVPLLAVLEGLVIVRPALTVRMGAGLILLVGGAGYLLLSKSWDSDSTLSIR